MNLPNLADSLFSTLREVDEKEGSSRRLPSLFDPIPAPLQTLKSNPEHNRKWRRPRNQKPGEKHSDSVDKNWRYSGILKSTQNYDGSKSRKSSDDSGSKKVFYGRRSKYSYPKRSNDNDDSDTSSVVSYPSTASGDRGFDHRNDRKYQHGLLSSPPHSARSKPPPDSDHSDNDSVVSACSSVSSRSNRSKFNRDGNSGGYEYRDRDVDNGYKRDFRNRGSRNERHFEYRGRGNDRDFRNRGAENERDSGRRGAENERDSSRGPMVYGHGVEDRQNSSKFNRNRSRNDGKKPERTRIYGYKYLHELSQKEPHQIIPEITKSDSPFDTYLNKDELNPDWLFLMLNIVKTVCLSEFQGNKNEMLDKICKSRFLHLISYYLGEVFMEKNEKTIANLESFVRDLGEFFGAVIAVLPSVAKEKDFKRHIMKTKVAIDQVNVNLKTNIGDEVTQKFDVLLAKMDDYEKALEKRNPKPEQRSFFDKLADMTPPENFRELSLYPTYADLMSDRLGFVRPNKIRGAYDDVEHYLDVQFRLLREDFIDPLRRGIKKFIESRSGLERKKKLKYESVRFYLRTQFEHVMNSKTNEVGLLLNFDPNKKMKNIKWQTSKRFMFGSLLLFTNDDFTSFFYGTVLDRDLDKLKDGKVLVKLAEDTPTSKNFFTTTFLMAESEVYFEPYYLVMKLLKSLDEHNFPMRKYIIEGRPDRDYPLYLQSFHTWDILGNDTIRTCQGLDCSCQTQGVYKLKCTRLIINKTQPA